MDHATAVNRADSICSTCFQNGNLYRGSGNAQYQQQHQQQHSLLFLSCGHAVTADATAILPMISQSEPSTMVNGDAFKNQISGFHSHGNYSEAINDSTPYQSCRNPGSALFSNMWIDRSIPSSQFYMGTPQDNAQTLAVDTSPIYSQSLAPISDVPQIQSSMPVVHLSSLQSASNLIEYNAVMSQGAQYLGQQQQLYVAHDDDIQIQATFQMQQHLQRQILQQPQQQTVTPEPISDSGPFQQLPPVLEPGFSSPFNPQLNPPPALIASMQTISFEPTVKPAAVPFPVTSAASSPLFPFSCGDMDITSASFMATNTALQPFAISDNNIITSNNIAMATSGSTSKDTDANAGPSFPAVQNVAQAMLEYENHSHINFSSGIPAPASMTNNYAPMSQPFSIPVSRASSVLQFDETMVARLNLHQDTAIVSQTAGLAIETSLPLYDILPLASGTNAIQKDACAPASMSAPTMPETKRPTALRRSQSEKVASIDALPLVTSFGQATSSSSSSSSSISRTPVMNRNRNMSQPIISPWSTVGAASTASSSSSHIVVSPTKSLSKSLRPLSTQFTFVTSTPQTNKEMFLGKIKTSVRRSSTPASQFQFQSPFQPLSTVSKSLLMDTSKTTMPTPRRVTNPSSSLDKVISAALPVSSSSSSRSSQPLFITFDVNKIDKSSIDPSYQHHQQRRLTQHPLSPTPLSRSHSLHQTSDSLSFTFTSASTSSLTSPSSEPAAIQRLPPKKPCNSYMIYRKRTFAKNRAYFQRGRCSGSDISKEIARLWNQEPECVKRLFEIEAEMERFRLKQTFPEYRYQRKSSNNKNGRKKKKH